MLNSEQNFLNKWTLTRMQTPSWSAAHSTIAQTMKHLASYLDLAGGSGLAAQVPMPSVVTADLTRGVVLKDTTARPFTMSLEFLTMDAKAPAAHKSLAKIFNSVAKGFKQQKLMLAW